MTAQTYKSLALTWVPDSQDQKRFYIIVAAVMVLALVFAMAISSVQVPPKERYARKAVPDRVANFITKKKEVEPPKPTATPKPSPPPPPPTPKPKVVRKVQEEKKPLTVEEKKARDTAQKSGLLALSAELNDLVDTSEVSQMVSARTRKSTGAAKSSSSVDTSVLTADAAAGSGGVSTSDHVAAVSMDTQLSEREVALVKQSLTKSDKVEDKNADVNKVRSGNVRTEEEVTIVFDQNKGALFSIYNRERRKKPGLKGKIVLEITIAPDGSVSNVKIASSELNDPDLERRIVARVKTFQFTAKNVEPVTVTYPIEFLPS